MGVHFSGSPPFLIFFFFSKVEKYANTISQIQIGTIRAPDPGVIRDIQLENGLSPPSQEHMMAAMDR